MAIILASQSPRREDLLRQIGCRFTVRASGATEDNSLAVPPEELAMIHARAKALDVARDAELADIVIGADTIVVVDRKVFGKPLDTSDARRMLTELSGREHQVITGIAVASSGQVWSDFAVTAVRIRQLGVQTIDNYLATGEPQDKAGAYAIQGVGALLVESIAGCYANVVGLPLVTLDNLLRRQLGVGLL